MNAKCSLCILRSGIFGMRGVLTRATGRRMTRRTSLPELPPRSGRRCRSALWLSGGAAASPLLDFQYVCRSVGPAITTQRPGAPFLTSWASSPSSRRAGGESVISGVIGKNEFKFASAGGPRSVGANANLSHCAKIRLRHPLEWKINNGCRRRGAIPGSPDSRHMAAKCLRLASAPTKTETLHYFDQQPPLFEFL